MYSYAFVFLCQYIFHVKTKRFYLFSFDEKTFFFYIYTFVFLFLYQYIFHVKIKQFYLFSFDNKTFFLEFYVCLPFPIHFSCVDKTVLFVFIWWQNLFFFFAVIRLSSFSNTFLMWKQNGFIFVFIWWQNVFLQFYVCLPFPIHFSCEDKTVLLETKPAFQMLHNLQGYKQVLAIKLW